MIYVSLFFLALIIGLILYLLPRRERDNDFNDIYRNPEDINNMYSAEFGNDERHEKEYKNDSEPVEDDEEFGDDDVVWHEERVEKEYIDDSEHDEEFGNDDVVWHEERVEKEYKDDLEPDEDDEEFSDDDDANDIIADDENRIE